MTLNCCFLDPGVSLCTFLALVSHLLASSSSFCSSIGARVYGFRNRSANIVLKIQSSLPVFGVIPFSITFYVGGKGVNNWGFSSSDLVVLVLIRQGSSIEPQIRRKIQF